MRVGWIAGIEGGGGGGLLVMKVGWIADHKVGWIAGRKVGGLLVLRMEWIAGLRQTCLSQSGNGS